MSKKTLNKINLEALGAARLADLLMEVSTGSADIKRRLRLELSHNLGPAELAHDIRKRLATLRKSKSFVGWRKRKALIADLNTQVTMIVERVAPDSPGIAFDLLWQFIDIAPSVYERVDDSRGDVGDVFRDALQTIAEIALRADLEPEALADRVWIAVSDNGYGEWDGIITELATILGPSGLSRLTAHVQAYADAPIESDPEDHDAIEFLRQLRGGENYAEARKARFVKSCLQEIAAAAGDADAYIAQYAETDLQRKDIAAEVATLYLDQDRADEALDLLSNVDHEGSNLGQEAWDDAYILTLTTLGQSEDAQTHRWSCFCRTLRPELLRAYLKQLPDFEDIEAEDRAKVHALSYPEFTGALRFLRDWPDLHGAANLVETRADEINGNLYFILSPAADALRSKYPRAAVLLWRAMIDYALGRGISSRYGHAANHFADCEMLDAEIEDYGPFAPHTEYAQELRARHDRKTSFWSKLR